MFYLPVRIEKFENLRHGCSLLNLNLGFEDQRQIGWYAAGTFSLIFNNGAVLDNSTVLMFLTFMMLGAS